MIQTNRTGYVALSTVPLDTHSQRQESDEPLLSSHPKSPIPNLLENRYVLGCAVFASIGGLTFGYDQGVIANVLVMKDFTQRWPIGAWEKGVMTAALELGALFGALASGILADRYSRRHSIFLACIIFCIGSLLQCLATSLNTLVIGRAVGGLGIGALSMLSPLYMAEISPPDLRGSLVALEQLSIVLGVVVGFWIGFLTRNIPSSASWRIPLALQLLPGVLLCLGCFFLPPSPRLLVLRGKSDEALRSLARLRLRPVDDPALQLELLEMRVEVGLIQSFMTSEDTAWKLGGWEKLFTKKWRGRTIIGAGMMFFQQWSGINALLYYGPTLMRSIGIGGLTGDKITLLVSGGIGIAQLVAVIPAIIYIDSWGRKPLLRGGSAVMAASHLVIALLVYQFSAAWSSHVVAAWIAVICVYIFTFAYGTSYGPIAWVLPSEVFPLSMRSKGVAVSTASNWINNFLIGLLTPKFMEISVAATFLIFSTCTFFGYLFSTYMVPETAGVSLEEIDAVFGTNVGTEDRELRLQIERNLRMDVYVADTQME